MKLQDFWEILFINPWSYCVENRSGEHEKYESDKCFFNPFFCGTFKFFIYPSHRIHHSVYDDEKNCSKSCDIGKVFYNFPNYWSNSSKTVGNTTSNNSIGVCWATSSSRNRFSNFYRYSITHPNTYKVYDTETEK